MVDSLTNLSGYYFWGENWPEFCITLRDDMTCSFYKSPESDYDLPLVPTGTSYNGHGTYTVEGNLVKYTGKGLYCFFGYCASSSSTAEPVEQVNEGEITIEDLIAHRKGDAADQINQYFNRIKG